MANSEGLIEAIQIAARRAKWTTDVEALSACARRLADHGDSELGCNGILERMQQHQAKTTPMFRSLNIACGALEPPRGDAAAARRCSV